MVKLVGYGKLRQEKHGLAVSIGSLLRHRDGGSAPVSQKSPGSFDHDVKGRLSVAFDRHDAERSLSRSDAGRQLTVFEGLPRLHGTGDDQLDIQHGNFAVCLQCGPVANSGLGYGKLMPISGSTRTCLSNASESFPLLRSILSSCRLMTPLQPH